MIHLQPLRIEHMFIGHVSENSGPEEIKSWLNLHINNGLECSVLLRSPVAYLPFSVLRKCVPWLEHFRSGSKTDTNSYHRLSHFPRRIRKRDNILTLMHTRLSSFLPQPILLTFIIHMLLLFQISWAMNR